MWSQDEPCVTSSNWVKFSEGKLKNVLMLTINLKPKLPLDGAGLTAAVHCGIVAAFKIC